MILVRCPRYPARLFGLFLNMVSVRIPEMAARYPANKKAGYPALKNAAFKQRAKTVLLLEDANMELFITYKQKLI